MNAAGCAAWARSRQAESGRRVRHRARCVSISASSTGCNSPRTGRSSTRGGLQVGGLLEPRGAAEGYYQNGMATGARLSRSERSRSSCAARGMPGWDVRVYAYDGNGQDGLRRRLEALQQHVLVCHACDKDGTWVRAAHTVVITCGGGVDAPPSPRPPPHRHSGRLGARGGRLLQPHGGASF